MCHAELHNNEFLPTPATSWNAPLSLLIGFVIVYEYLCKT